MQTFINKNFTKRDYNCTNIVCCVADTAPNDNWIAADESAIKADMQQIKMVGNVRYFGYL